MASSNAAPISGRERIRVIQGGWEVWLDRPMMTSLLAMTSVPNNPPRPFMSPTTILGTETFSAWQEGTKITMNAADLATFLAGSGNAPAHPGPQPTTFMGNELIVGHQSVARIAWTIAEVAAIQAAASNPNAPQNLTAPTISGTPQVGSVLTATPGTYTNTPTSYLRQFKANGIAVGPNSTGLTYTPVTGDIGAVMTVTETATNAFGSAQATSAATAAVTAASGAYTGQIATRAAPAKSVSTSLQAIQSQTAHTSTDASPIRVSFPAWYANSTNGEQPTADISYRAAIEYPFGTYTAITWSGTRDKVATAGFWDGTGLSDASITVPVGAVFRILNLATAATASMPIDGTYSLWTAQGEGSEVSASPTGLTDKTLTGGIVPVAPTVPQTIIYPLRIIGTATKPSFALVGTSRFYGQQTGIDSTTGTQGEAEPILGNSYGFINMGVQSESAFNATKRYTRRALLVKNSVSHIIQGLAGINDLAASLGNRTAAQMAGISDRFTALLGGSKPIIGITIAPKTTSTDSWATTANQTADGNSASLASWNTTLLAANPWMQAVMDVNGVVSDGSLIKWNAPPARTADGLHGNATMRAAIAAANLLPSGVAALSASGKYYMPDAGTPLGWFDATDDPNSNGRINATSSALFSAINYGTYGATAFQGGPGTNFSGTLNRATIASEAVFTTGRAAVTFAMLCQIDTLPATRDFISANTATNGSTRAGVSVSPTGQLGLSIRRLDADALTSALSASPVITAGAPFVIVAVYNPTTGVANLYLNANTTPIATANFLSTGSFDTTASANFCLAFNNPNYTAMTIREFDVIDGAVANPAKLAAEIAWRQGFQSVITTGPYAGAGGARPTLAN